MNHDAEIMKQLKALSEQVSALTETRTRHDELVSEMLPIAKLFMGVASQRLETLDQKGYFRFGRALLEVFDKIVEAYTPEDVALFAENVVAMLDVVRALTQPQVLELVSEVSEAAAQVDNVEPVGVMGMLKASQEQDAQRGMAVLVEVLRRLGKGVRKAERRQRLSEQLGPRLKRGLARRVGGRRAAAPRPLVRSATAPEPSAPPPPAAALPSIGEGIELTAEGFLADASKWTPQLAERLARSLGVTLTERHYQLIEFARNEYSATGASPNIRRLSLGSGISTKELYQMFPRAPGKSTAMIAGLPKPVGCI